MENKNYLQKEPMDLYSKIQPLVIADARNQAEQLLRQDQFTVATTQGHTHNGTDALQIPYDNLSNKFFCINYTLPGTSGATAGNYGVFFIAPYPCLVTGFQEVHQTAGTDGGSVTLQLEKLTGTQAPDSGTVLLQTALDLKGTANTVQNGLMVVSSNPTIQLTTTFLAKGDRLCLKDSGTLTSVANVTVVVKLLVLP